jgi:hypothetical protein
MQPNLLDSQENTHQIEQQPQGQVVPQQQIQQTPSDVSVGKQDVGVKAWVDSTPSQLASTAFLITGLISFLLAGNKINEFNFESAFFLFGVSLTCFFGSVVVAAHAVEKAIKEQ